MSPRSWDTSTSSSLKYCINVPIEIDSDSTTTSIIVPHPNGPIHITILPSDSSSSLASTTSSPPSSASWEPSSSSSSPSPLASSASYSYNAAYFDGFFAAFSSGPRNNWTQDDQERAFRTVEQFHMGHLNFGELGRQLALLHLQSYWTDVGRGLEDILGTSDSGVNETYNFYEERLAEADNNALVYERAFNDAI
ncbi:hypothetical protein BC941DRAFT_477458 [Chlamydoabsidia padenii]|nr:hypothetical protein BC941DRAFT_477458 [Chlamydoabsidia padenii]